MHKLEEMFNSQKNYRKKIGKGQDFLENLSEKEKGEWTRNYLDYIRQEIAEAYDCLAYKHWDANGKVNRNKILKPENLKIELVDMFFFLIDILNVNDMGPNELYEFYNYKLDKNIKRQEENYNVLTKTEEDNLSIEEKIKQYYEKNGGQNA